MVRGLSPDVVATLEERGLVTATFRRLTPERQQAVVLAILEEAFSRGPSRIRLKESAQAAGIAVGSLYQYFGNRQGVIDFTVTFAADLLAAELRGYAPALAELPLADGLRRWVGSAREWTAEHAAVMRFFARAAYEGDPSLERGLVAPIAQAMLEAITTMLAAAQERGEVRPDVDLPVAASVVHAALAAASDAATVNHLGSYLLPGQPLVGAQATIEATVELLCRGLA